MTALPHASGNAQGTPVGFLGQSGEGQPRSAVLHRDEGCRARRLSAGPGQGRNGKPRRPGSGRLPSCAGDVHARCRPGGLRRPWRTSWLIVWWTVWRRRKASRRSRVRRAVGHRAALSRSRSAGGWRIRAACREVGLYLSSLSLTMLGPVGRQLIRTGMNHGIAAASAKQHAAINSRRRGKRRICSANKLGASGRGRQLTLRR